MQTIFYNARIMTMNKKEPEAEAMLVNDGSLVFVGKNDEVLNLKQDDTMLIDLKNKFVIPTFFDNNIQVYEMIEDVLKNAKKLKNIEIFDEKDENYENFANFEIYKKEFLKLQEEFLKHGITTIQELNITPAEFVFWKKMADEKLLKIDIVGYVDMISSKKIMDDNCRSYRKYKNHFRLGGYSLALDGDVFEKKAWLLKPYKKEHGYCGYAECFEEQLYFLLKTALEEKKQLVVRANGDRAITQFLEVFEDVVKKEKVEDKYKPVILNAGLISKKNIFKMKELEIVPSFQIEDVVENEKQLKQTLGLLRAKKYQPYKLTKSLDIKFLVQTKSKEIRNVFDILTMLTTSSALHKKESVLTVEEAWNSLLLVAADKVFDSEQKGSLESGKNADFLVVDFDGTNFANAKIKDVYLKGEKIK